MEFYSVQLREKIEVPDNDVEITVAENGRRQARATVQKDGKAIKLFKFLPNAAAAPVAPAAAATATKGTKGAEGASTASPTKAKEATGKTKA